MDPRRQCPKKRYSLLVPLKSRKLMPMRMRMKIWKQRRSWKQRRMIRRILASGSL